MNATILCADSAQIQNGKLFALGAGWSRIASGVDGLVGAHAVVVTVDVPADRVGQQLGWKLVLCDAGGAPLRDPDRPNLALLAVEGVLRAEPEPNAMVDLPRGVPVVALIEARHLAKGTYTWRFALDGNLIADRSFTVVTPSAELTSGS